MTINTFATCFYLIYSKEIMSGISLDLLNERYDVIHTRATMPIANINEIASKRVRQSFDRSQEKQATFCLPCAVSLLLPVWPVTKVSFPTQIRRKNVANTTCTSPQFQNAFGKCSKTEQIQPPHYWLYQNSLPHILWVKTVIIGVDLYSPTAVCRNTKHEFRKMNRVTDFLFMICLWYHVKAEIVTDISSGMFMLPLHLIFRHQR